jgi:hypothetical protein
MDLSILMPWVGAALSIIALVTQAKSFFSSGEKALDKRLETAEKTLIDHDRRVQKMENELAHLPDKDTVLDLKLALAELKGTVSTLGETVGSVSRTVHRIDDFLRQEGKK